MQELRNYFDKQDLKDYCLFLDRDGVINEPIVDDYAKRPEDFTLTDHAVEAIAMLQSLFKRIVIVTNQQGIGRGLMSMTDLEDVHLKMHKSLKDNNLPYFDAVFYAPYLRSEEHQWRKPKSGMAQQAIKYFPDLDPKKMVLVGDSPGDMQLAEAIGATKVRIANPQFEFDDQDLKFNSLYDFALNLTQL
jgi:histidinol-phosphate phosphatase family protein